MRNESGVLYMLQGNKHAVVLAVSIWSLRKSGFIGPVHIAIGDDKAEEICTHIAADPRLGPITTARWQPPTGKRGTVYLAKTHMQDLSPFERTLFIDADTLVVGDINPLFEFGQYTQAGPAGVALTQFSNWQSNGRKISGRIKPWVDVVPDDVKEMQSKAYPAINTGVISFDRSAGSQAFFEDWRSTTEKKVVFICDELAAQLIFHRHAVRVLDDRYNASPIHSERARTGDAVIYHCHGKKHVNKPAGRKIWLPVYEECVKHNLANIREWTPAGDRRLKEFLADRDGAGRPDEDREEETTCKDADELTNEAVSAQ
jgi:lipopolysaccharide biosynthesis glycosyltransferase